MLLASGASPAVADISPEELEEAKEALLAVHVEVQELTDRFEEAVGAKERSSMPPCSVTRLRLGSSVASRTPPTLGPGYAPPACISRRRPPG